MSKLNSIYAPSTKLTNRWFQISLWRNDLSRWSHDQIKDTPTLRYRFKHTDLNDEVQNPDNYRGDEQELLSRIDDVEQFAQTWWEKDGDDGDSLTHQEQYSYELGEEMYTTIKRLKAKYEKKFRDDFHKEFDPLLKFINSKPVEQPVETE